MGESGHVVGKEQKSKIGQGPDLLPHSKRSCSVCHDKTCRGRGRKIFCPLHKKMVRVSAYLKLAALNKQFEKHKYYIYNSMVCFSCFSLLGRLLLKLK